MQESSCKLSSETQKLGKFAKGHNASRDFWRHAKLPVATQKQYAKLALVKDSNFESVFFWHQSLGAFLKDIRTVDALVDLSEEGIDEPVTRSLPMVCLVSLFTFLFSSNFGLEISEAALNEYWQHASTCFSWGSRHPGGKGYIPCALYGDSARYTSGQGLVEKLLCLVVSFPLFAPASTRISRFLVFSIRESLVVSFQATIWPIFQKITDQFSELFQGLLIGNRRLHFTCTELRGDWEWHVNSLNLKPRWGSHAICFKCGASRVDETMQWTNFTENAGWRGKEYSHVQFILTCLKPGPVCNLIDAYVRVWFT